MPENDGAVRETESGRSRGDAVIDRGGARGYRTVTDRRRIIDPGAQVLIGTAAAIDVKVFILAGQSNMEGHGVATMAAGAFDGNGTTRPRGLLDAASADGDGAICRQTRLAELGHAGTVEYSCANPSWRDLPVCATAAVPPREGCRAEAADFDGLMDENGNFTVFDNAFVVFEGSQSKRGNLTIGYGFQDAWIGPERRGCAGKHASSVAADTRRTGSQRRSAAAGTAWACRSDRRATRRCC